MLGRVYLKSKYSNRLNRVSILLIIGFCRMLKVHLAAKVIEQWALIVHENNLKT